MRYVILGVVILAATAAEPLRVTSEAEGITTLQEYTESEGITPLDDYSKLEQRYASADGAPGADGSLENPWSPTAAAIRASPGMVINYLPGTYTSMLEPSSGEPGNPIVLRSFERHKAVLADGAHFKVDNESHIHFVGFRVKGKKAGEGGRWALIEDGYDIVIRDNYFTREIDLDTRHGTTPFQIRGGVDIRILNNLLHEGAQHNMFTAVGDVEGTGSEVRRIVFEANSVTRAGHGPMQFIREFDEIVVRGNVFHGVVGRNLEFFGDSDYVLFEHNLMTNAYNGPNSASEASSFYAQNMIVRFNRFVNNRGTSFELWPFAEWHRAGKSRFYHNVMHGNDSYAVRVRDRDDRPGDIAALPDLDFSNNLFTENNDGAFHLWVRLNKPESDLQVQHNLFDGNEAVEHHESVYSVGELETEFSDIYSGNVAGPAGYTNSDNLDFSLTPESGAIDAGMALTRTRNSGSGQPVAVEDARPFYDGYGIEGERGDMVQIGNQVARVLKTDVEAHELWLDRSLEWAEGDPVSLPWSGEGPDIGMYSYGEGLAHVQVIQPARAMVDEPVEFELAIHGDIEPVEVAWQFGDGIGALGKTVTHRYDKPQDYAIRVRVIDEEGAVHRATGYVFISDENTRTFLEAYNRAEVTRLITGPPAETSTEPKEERPGEFKINHNYPNPFNPSTQIRYALPEPAHVRVTVYNLIGLQIATLVNETRSAGWHEEIFDAGGLSSGVFIYRIEAGNHVETGQMMLVK